MDAIKLALQAYFPGSTGITFEPLLDWVDAAWHGESPGTDPWRDAARSLGMFWTLSGVCIATERPSDIHLDNEGELHNAKGMSVRYRSGWGLYHWHGVNVPDYVILAPETITVENIDVESDSEIRRVMLERFGWQKYLLSSGGCLVHQDDFGELYFLPAKDGEPLGMVKVINSTPEPDGTFKDYFLRVPPTMRTAREAVAWTFGKAADMYAPQAQT